MATTRTKPSRKAAPVADPGPVKDPAPLVAPPDQPIPARPAPRPKDAPRTMRELRLAREGKRASRAKPVENVLRDGLRLERVPDPSIVVLFGATGDLAHRKVIPALYHLWRTNLLPHEFMLVAIGRRPYTDESFRAEIRASLEQFSRVLPIDVEAWETFEQRIDYKRLDFDDDDGFDLLAKYLDDHDAEHGTRGNRLFYLATQPSQFADLVGQLGRVGLDHEHHDGGWRRIVIEKPFGHDLESAKRLNREVGKVFRESQVYRIDHYLGKETVRNLLVFRFGNGIFEPLWNRRYVDHVQITVAESIGVEDRGAFYEQTGAARDVLQNHLLQLVSLVAMEPPATFEANALRDEKVKVLRAIDPQPGRVGQATSSAASTGRAGSRRPRSPGYREEPEVDPQSETETFVAARLTIDDWRWSGVPFYVRTGKRLPKRATEIAIQYREVPHHLFRDEGVGPDANLLAIRIQPDEGIMLRFGAKVPGLGLDVRSVTMDFTYGSAFNVDSPGRVRDPHPRRPPGRRIAVHARRRGRGGVGHRRSDRQRLGGRTRARLPELRRRHVGARGRRGAAGPGRPALAPALGIERVAAEAPARIGIPRLRWTARAQSIAGIETELARAWSSQDPGPHEPGDMGRHMAARTNVMNLVVVARRPELAERCAATMHWLTGRHPSRTIVIQSADPDGPSWLDARIEAHCVEPRADAPETCAETIYVTCGGEAGRHLSAVATPLIIHDLPVTVWWPGEPPLASATTRDLLDAADRLVVDGSTWSGDGLGRLHEMAELQDSTSLAISDFALMRQSRWREAIASIFDDPEFLPYLRSLRRIAITYSTHDEAGAPGSTNVVKPIYHVGWLASRLGLSVERPLTPVGGGPKAAASTRAGKTGGKPIMGRGLVATLSDGRSDVGVVVRPVLSTTPPGTTLRVELLAERRGRELRADVTAEAEIVHVRVWQDGVEALDRHFRAPRRNDTDLLAEAIEANRGDPIASGALRSAALLIGGDGGPHGHDASGGHG